MAFPFVLTRMEELHHLGRNGVKTRQVRPLVLIAVAKGEREVFERGFASVLLGDDVVVLERQFCERSGEMAILATMLRPFAHSLLDGCVHWAQAAAVSRKGRRALVFRNSKARPTFK